MVSPVTRSAVRNLSASGASGLAHAAAASGWGDSTAGWLIVGSVDVSPGAQAASASAHAAPTTMCLILMCPPSREISGFLPRIRSETPSTRI